MIKCKRGLFDAHEDSYSAFRGGRRRLYCEFSWRSDGIPIMIIEDLIIGWLALMAAKILRDWDDPPNDEDDDEKSS